MRFLAQAIRRPVAPALSVWLVGFAAFTVLGVETLFATPHAAFVFARLAAYISSITVAALTIGIMAIFALGSGAMLWWLDDRVDSRRVVACAGRSFWCVAVYTWIAFVLLLVDPPSAVPVAAILEPDALEARTNDLLAFQWLFGMRFAVLGAFLVAMVWLLHRDAKLVNAVIAVAFAAGLIAASLTALGLLAGGEEF